VFLTRAAPVNSFKSQSGSLDPPNERGANNRSQGRVVLAGNANNTTNVCGSCSIHVSGTTPYIALASLDTLNRFEVLQGWTGIDGCARETG
jgi:hypothetical protein